MTFYVSKPSWDLVLTFDPQLQQGPFSYSFCLFIHISVHVVANFLQIPLFIVSQDCFFNICEFIWQADIAIMNKIDY